MAGLPEELTESPNPVDVGKLAMDDALSDEPPSTGRFRGPMACRRPD